ncbi:hypothetical protein KUTeg_021870, partial [Tegillarca granosa]
KAKTIADTPAKENRKFKTSWQTDFNFLRYDREQNLMFCALCEKTDRRDAIVKHTFTEDYTFAIAASEMKGDNNAAAIKARKVERTAVEGLKQNLNYLAKRNEPSSAISDLNSFLLHHNLSKFDPVKVNDPKKKGLKYEHIECEMQTAMAKVVQQDLLDDINFGVFSIMADESTDVSNEKTVMLFVSYEKNGAPCVKFLEVNEIAGDECNSKNI